MEARILQTDVQGNGRPLALLPGGLTGWLSWIPHQERLAKDFRVIRIQPLHNEFGSNGRRGDPTYTVETDRESLRLTLDDLGLERTHFGAWSRGAAALVEFSLAYPDRVRSLTLVEPPLLWVLAQLEENHPDAERTTALLRSFRSEEVTEDDLAEFLILSGVVRAGGDPRKHPGWPGWAPHRMALSWPTDGIDSSKRSVTDLASITAPVLLVLGAETSAWQRRVMEVLHEQLPNARLLELPGGHAAHIESMDRFLKAFREHLDLADESAAHPP